MTKPYHSTFQSNFQLVTRSKRLIPKKIAQIKINECQPKYVQINLLPLTYKKCNNKSKEIKKLSTSPLVSTSPPCSHKRSKTKIKGKH